MKRALFILGVLEDEDVDWLISVGRRQELSPGSVVIQEGHPCDDIFLILDGLLAVSVATLDHQPIAQLTSGEVVGEMSFVDGLPPSATVSAEQPSLVLAIACAQLRQKLLQDIWFAARFHRAMAILLSSRLRSTVKHLQGEHWRPVAFDNHSGRDEMGEMLSVGAIRFNWMLKRLRDINGNPWEDLEQHHAD
jgi:CRP/FNR family cyclic AMP-dependent transcriptional regulator